MNKENRMVDNISIVIPCYNSEKTIENVVNEIVDTLSDKLEYEIVLVNDGSTYELWNIICSLADKYPNIVKGIRFAKNFGQHAALMAAYRASSGDVVVQMDDDGQSNPIGIFSLLAKIDEGYDVVFAKYPQAKKTLFRQWGSDFNRKMNISLLGMPKDIYPMSFSAFRRYVVEEMIRYDKPYPYVGGLIFRATSNICNVEIEHRERAEGKSNYNLRKLIKLWLNGFTAFSVKPLEVASVSGFIISICGFIYALYIIISRIVGVEYLEGWTSLIALTLILDGFILIMIGLVGEYIGRMYISMNNSPQYVIRDEYGFDKIDVTDDSNQQKGK